MNNEDAEWWHTNEGSEQEQELLEQIKNKTNRVVLEVIEEPPF